MYLSDGSEISAASQPDSDSDIPPAYASCLCIANVDFISKAKNDTVGDTYNFKNSYHKRRELLGLLGKDSELSPRFEPCW
jgi:hypothetical protein